MGKEVITFGDTEIEKHRFCYNKTPMLIYDIDVNKIVASSKFSLYKRSWLQVR